MDIKNPLFTVFTPTYQRAHTLKRLYESLLRQQEKDFEWIIVDDGSTDNTKEVVDNFISQAKIEIKYVFQENAGKHTAHNEALNHANGYLFLVIDSDDELTDGCLKNFKKIWEQILPHEREFYAGIIGNITSNEKDSVDQEFEGNFFDMLLKKKISGEKLHLIRTDLMKNNPFPVANTNNDFMIEGIVWLRATRDKKVIYSSYQHRTYHRDDLDEESLMKKGANPLYGALGKAIYCNEELSHLKSSYLPFIFFFIKSALKLNRYSSHSGLLLSERFARQQNKFGIFLIILTFPFGEIISVIDRIRFQS